VADPETVVLDRSGLVLQRHSAQHPRWHMRAGDHEFIVEQTFIDGSRWYSGSCFVAGDQTRYCVGHHGTRDECLAWLDARVIELRSALMPPGSFVVADTDNTRAALNRALDPFKQICLDGVWRAHGTPDAITDAVLAALREAGR